MVGGGNAPAPRRSMTAAAYHAPRRRGIVGRFFAGRFVAVVIVVAGVVAIWYAGAAYLNAPFQHQLDATAGRTPELREFVQETWAQARPVLPAPHQIAEELYRTVVLLDPTSKRSLVYHGWITLSSTLAGFVLGTLLGIL